VALAVVVDDCWQLVVTGDATLHIGTNARVVPAPPTAGDLFRTHHRLDIAEAHDWELTLTDSASSGARFEFTGMEIVTQLRPIPSSDPDEATRRVKIPGFAFPKLFNYDVVTADRMKCAECGGDSPSPTEVTYVDGSTERIHLCAECRATFEAGELVQSATPVE
jgi:hypothetical protein